MCLFFFFNDTATTEIYTLSLHDALPIYRGHGHVAECRRQAAVRRLVAYAAAQFALEFSIGIDEGVRHRSLLPGVSATADRKSTRLNSSHANISYAVFCLKKKTTIIPSPT